MKKYFDENMGWGEIIAETENYIVVRFDADPWFPVQIRKI